MDWNRVYTPGPAAKDPPAPTVLEVCWRVRAPGKNRVCTCAIVRDAAPGVEVRAFFGDDDVLRSERAAEIGAAREIAAVWKATVIEKGFVEIVDQKGTM